jgi:hypothetical protein
MLKWALLPHTDGRMIIYIGATDTFPTGSVGGHPLVTGSKLVVTGAEPKEYLWNGREWVSDNSSSGGTEMVYNGTGSSIAAGKLIYRNGWNATYNCFTVALADADVSGAQAELVATEAIANGATGAASTAYELTGQNTSAASAVGDPVYLDTTAGGWTLTAPTGSDDVVQVVGRVSVDHASTGKIRFKLPGVLKEIGTNELQDDSVTLDKLADITQGSIIVGGASNAPTLLGANDSGKILVGDGTDLKSVAVSGDATLANTGAVTLVSGIARAIYGQATTAEVNAGKTILAGTAGKAIKIIDVKLQAVGGNATTATSVDIGDTDNNIFFSFGVASLTEGAVPCLGSVTMGGVPLHGAFAAGNGIKIGKTGAGALETCTAINYCVTYCYENS